MVRTPALALALLAAAPALAQPLAGDATAGRRFALAICDTCHQVRPSLGSAPGDPPSFSAIANLPSTTALSLTVFLRTSHGNMPNLILTKPDADDVIAYILSLKRR